MASFNAKIRLSFVVAIIINILNIVIIIAAIIYVIIITAILIIIATSVSMVIISIVTIADRIVHWYYNCWNDME